MLLYTLSFKPHHGSRGSFPRALQIARDRHERVELTQEPLVG